MTFPVSQREFLRRAAGRKASSIVTDIKVATPFCRWHDVSTRSATINFVDVTRGSRDGHGAGARDISQSRGGLIDGQLVRVVLESGNPKRRSSFRKRR